ncbi:GPI transamidase component PIG-T [Amylostereum chailletii]|nr:GPI transamidase component PIG-T [Amylostereum chailletii]
MRWHFTGLLLCTLLSDWAGAMPGEEYHEDLSLRPLRDGRLAAKFSFKTLLNGMNPRAPEALDTDDDSQHYTLFPLALGQVLREYAVTELHLNLNAGRWDYDRWGPPEEPSVGTGAELWAWMGEGAPSSIDARWKGTQNALAGLFCASLGGMDTQRTTTPTRAFPPTGDLPLLPSPNVHRLRHATLPAEHVCTENLTPFLKLLPCPAQAGVAALLEPHRIFDADWHGLGVDVRWIAGQGVELKLTVQAVFDPVRTSPEERRDWTFRSIFDRTIPRACPVASSSHVRVALPPSEGYTLEPEPSSQTDTSAVYEISRESPELDIAMRWPRESKFVYPLDLMSNPSSDFSVLRALKGASQTQGELSLVLRNNLPVTQRVLYLETMPWHVEFYLHTLRVFCEYNEPYHLFGNMTYTLPVPHATPALLQAVFTLPPQTTLRVRMNVRKSFLRYTEHPPDAQRGWDLPPAVFVPLSEGGTRASARVYTPTLLVDLATPDFSMPYNVIIMTCTLIALIFGSLFNYLTRRFVVVKLDESEGTKDEAVSGSERGGLLVRLLRRRRA